jgi:hypothetical protein
MKNYSSLYTVVLFAFILALLISCKKEETIQESQPEFLYSEGGTWDGKIEDGTHKLLFVFNKDGVLSETRSFISSTGKWLTDNTEYSKWRIVNENGISTLVKEGGRTNKYDGRVFYNVTGSSFIIKTSETSMDMDYYIASDVDYEMKLVKRAGVPKLKTNSIGDITGSTASCISEITSIGGSPVTSRGACWSKLPNPTIADNFSTNVTGTDLFTCIIAGLLTSTTYYVRTFATNSQGTGYGNEMEIKTAKYTIGQSILGGKVAYILQPGEPGYVAGEIHGLIATPNDLSPMVKWSYSLTTTTNGQCATGYGTGKGNTSTILFLQDYQNYAARLCDALVLSNYDDWYLPSKDELNKLYINRVAIGGFNSDASYWSSSDDSQRSYAWRQQFNAGNQYLEIKTSPNSVRAIRYF